MKREIRRKTLQEATDGFFLNKKMLSNICSFQTGFNDLAGHFASRFVFVISNAAPDKI
jgi:hypothetical protein